MANINSHQIAVTFSADLHAFGEVNSPLWRAQVARAMAQATSKITNDQTGGQITGEDGETIGAFIVDVIR